MRLAHYVHLVDTKFTKWSNFVREAWLIKEKWNKRSCLTPPMNADARRCSAPLIGVNRRASAVLGLPPLCAKLLRFSGAIKNVGRECLCLEGHDSPVLPPRHQAGE